MNNQDLKKITLLGAVALSGCMNTTSVQNDVETLPKEGIVTDATLFKTCEGKTESYYFEIDTDTQRMGSEYAGIVHFSCGKEAVHTAQKEYPVGAPINIQKSAPIFSRLLHLNSQDVNDFDVVLQKACYDKLRVNTNG